MKCLISPTEMQALVARHPADRRFALAIMQDLQQEYNYIPREGMGIIAKHIGSTTGQLYAMATFYKALSLKPKGKHIIKVCDGTACHIRGSAILADGVCRALNIMPGETSADGLFSLELVNCLGSCAIAPAMVIDETYYGKVTLEKLAGILASYQEVEV